VESRLVARNWMFYGSDNGGTGQRAVLTSFITTCKKTRHRSVRLSARHLPNASANPSRQPARRAASRPMGLLRGGSPNHLSVLLAGDLLWCKNELFSVRGILVTRGGARRGGKKESCPGNQFKVTAAAAFIPPIWRAHSGLGRRDACPAGIALLQMVHGLGGLITCPRVPDRPAKI